MRYHIFLAHLSPLTIPCLWLFSLLLSTPLFLYVPKGSIVGLFVYIPIHLHPHFSWHSNAPCKTKLLHGVSGLYIHLSARPISLDVTRASLIPISKTTPKTSLSTLLPPFLFLTVFSIQMSPKLSAIICLVSHSNLQLHNSVLILSLVFPPEIHL